MRHLATGLALAWSLAAAPALPAAAELPIEQPGRVETLSLPYGDHWVWVGDPVLRRSALVDADSGRMLGMVGSGFGIPVAMPAPDGRSVYVPETHYTRGSRGERADVLTFYRSETLLPEAEVLLPPKRAINAVPVASDAISDDGRFAAIFNMTPATSFSVVDLAERRLAGAVATPGCSLVYPAGPRRFLALCMDGALLQVTLDDRGAERARHRSEPFFDPQEDPVTEKGVRFGDRWLFVSFLGVVHPVDVSAEVPAFDEPWPLLGPGDAGWRVGGTQHLAVHRASGLLYSLVHEGGEHSHKDSGTEVWVYDLASRERVRRIELQNAGFTYLGVPMEFGRDWVWPFDRLSDWLLAAAPNLGVDLIAVTQDDAPLLVTANAFSGALATYDAKTGAFLRRVYSGNTTNGSLRLAVGSAP